MCLLSPQQQNSSSPKKSFDEDVSGEKLFTHSERQKASGQKMCLRKNELEGALWKSSVAVLDKKKKRLFWGVEI